MPLERSTGKWPPRKFYRKVALDRSTEKCPQNGSTEKCPKMGLRKNAPKLVYGKVPLDRSTESCSRSLYRTGAVPKMSARSLFADILNSVPITRVGNPPIPLTSSEGGGLTTWVVLSAGRRTGINPVACSLHHSKVPLDRSTEKCP